MPTAAPVRPITSPPGYHWFGYYDKLQFDASCRYALGMEAAFEHRAPRDDDVIRIGMIDLAEGNRWRPLGQSRAWCWQQGCMLQWRPGHEGEILWNDREGDQYVCHVLNVATAARRTLPRPIYTVSGDGATALGLDFTRLGRLRPGYGYVGAAEIEPERLAPEGAGIYRMDLERGDSAMIISIAQLASIPNPHCDMAGREHYVNHLLFSPDGSRFVFLHRWKEPSDPAGFLTRMMTAAPDGSDLRVVNDSGRTSHFIWKDARHILAWAERPSHGRGFYVFEDGTGREELLGEGVLTRDGHCSYLPGGRWIVCDGSVHGGRRDHTLYLYDAASGQKVMLGAFASPPAYAGQWRCDLHPRFSPDGRSVVFDSPHGGDGRQMYLVDISGIVG
jgi:hypothetical protein